MRLTGVLAGLPELTKHQLDLFDEHRRTAVVGPFQGQHNVVGRERSHPLQLASGVYASDNGESGRFEREYLTEGRVPEQGVDERSHTYEQRQESEPDGPLVLP